VPERAIAGTPLSLAGATIVPYEASYGRTITWELVDPLLAGASITGTGTYGDPYTLNTTTEGLVFIEAIVPDGLAIGTPFKSGPLTIIVDPAFVPVSDIVDGPTAAKAGVPLTLTGTVMPADATHRTIEWSVYDAGTTGANVQGSTLNALTAGTAVIRATIIDGLALTGTPAERNFVEDFQVVIAGADEGPFDVRILTAFDPDKTFGATDRETVTTSFQVSSETPQIASQKSEPDHRL
jgi:hypothetical protein